ncbi:hypothetical protein AURDEDRAFT_115304 [Auricularia subglabra TFB-10046 SS5]|nr:hypothetical protein AURDEDRAFT_115304 [Auricularia subglabra TFB-10046 SS5]
MSDTTATGTDFDVLSLASSFPGDLSEPVSPKIAPQRRPSLRQRLEQDRLFYRVPLEPGAAVLRLERIWNNLCTLWPQDAQRSIDVNTQLEKLEMLEELLELVVLMRVQCVRTCLHEFYANATTIIKLSRATEGELQAWWNVTLHAAQESVPVARPLEERTRQMTREVFGRLWELREAAITQRDIEGLLTPAELELEGCEESDQIGGAIDVPDYGQIRCRLWVHRDCTSTDNAHDDTVYEDEGDEVSVVRV